MVPYPHIVRFAYRHVHAIPTNLLAERALVPHHSLLSVCYQRFSVERAGVKSHPAQSVRGDVSADDRVIGGDVRVACVYRFVSQLE